MLKRISLLGLTGALILAIAGLAGASNYQGELEKALKNFEQSEKQRLVITYQASADPNYNTAELVLQYPAGCWHSEHRLDKYTHKYYALEGFDGMVQELVRIGKKVYLRLGEEGPYQPVRNQQGYRQMLIDSLTEVKDLLPLKSAYNIKKIGEEQIQDQLYQIFTFQSKEQDKLIGKKQHGQTLENYQNKIWLKQGEVYQVLYFQVYDCEGTKNYVVGKIRFSCPNVMKIDSKPSRN